ncbi:MAG: hypothetical protein V6Z81_08275 [Parvularculales bacterium]
MKSLTASLSLRSRALAVAAIALVMAFAFSGPVVFTATPVHANDFLEDVYCGITGSDHADCQSSLIPQLDELKYAGDRWLRCPDTGCYDDHGNPQYEDPVFGLVDDIRYDFMTPAHAGDDWVGCVFGQCNYHDDEGNPNPNLPTVE